MDDKRLHDRIPYKVKITCYKYYNPMGELITYDDPIEIEVFDIAIGGVGIISSYPFPNSSILEFTLYLETIPYHVMAKVKWSSEKEGFNQFGLELLIYDNMLYRHLKTFTKGGSIFDM